MPAADASLSWASEMLLALDRASEWLLALSGTQIGLLSFSACAAVVERADADPVALLEDAREVLARPQVHLLLLALPKVSVKQAQSMVKSP